ncbi:hypothetical protein KCU62_g8299, partial [Aureobasidium sp. EXF-3399]
LASRSFSCTGYTSHRGGPQRTPQQKEESNRANQRLWRAKNKDHIKEKNRKHYEARKAALLQSGDAERTKNSNARKKYNRRYYQQTYAAVSHYQKQILNKTGTLEAISKWEAKRRLIAERKVERERQRAEVIVEGERRHDASKAETERRRAEVKAVREQEVERQRQRTQEKAMLEKERATRRAAKKAGSERRRAEGQAERQGQLTQEKAMLAKEQAKRRAAKADARLEATHDSLRRRAERAESARRRAAEKSEREQRREQRAERERHLEHQKAIRAHQRATSRAAAAKDRREAAREKAAEYRRDADFRKAVVAGEQQRRTRPDYAHRQDMRTWLLRCAQRDQFSWKTHVPVVYEDKTVKTCTACGKTRLAGSRLWWKSLVNPDTYVCHLCYTADCSRAMPRGFEDYEFGKGKHLKP